MTKSGKSHRVRWQAFTALLLANCMAVGAEIERVEPPFWWQGFKETGLQILIYGEDAGSLVPSIDYDGVGIDRVERVDNPNYLFLYLQIDPAASTGEIPISLADGERSHVVRYPLHPKNPDPAHARGFTSADTIYLITPDRFANGETANDNVPGFGDHVDRDEWGGRHGGDIEGIVDSLDYIQDMGFTAIWLNPLLENEMPSYSYHGYSTTDFFAVDPRYGSNEAYRDMVAAAKARGIGVIMDMIVNHVGSEHWWMHDLPDDEWINFGGEYFQTNHQHITWQDPYVSDYDEKAFADGWFVPTMPDLNQRHPLLADYLTQNALWWIEYLGLAGIRMDTYPYPDKDYMTEWTRRVMTEYPDFNVVGEEWNASPAVVSYWQAGKENHDDYVSYLPSLMDFPLRDAMTNSLNADKPPFGSDWEPVYHMLATDFLYPDPSSLVIFPDNHDMSRIFTQLEEDYDLYRMAIAYVLTMRGTPQIYYGTEILMSNRESDDHGLIRSDFPGGWTGDRVNAFTGEGLSAQQREAQTFMRRLIRWRNEAPVIHSGKLMHFTPIDRVYAYFRYDDEDTVMVIFNKADDTVLLDLDRFEERLGDATRATDVISGRRYNVERSIALEPRSVLVLEIDR